MEQVRNAQFAPPEGTYITGEWLHPELGWIPYTAIRGESEIMDAVFDAFLASNPAPYQEHEMTEAEVKQLRMMVYASESDPLFMEWQYDETPHTHAIWMDKVRDIKLRYPLPISQTTLAEEDAL